MKKISLFLLCLLVLACKPKVEQTDQSYYYEQIVNNITAELQTYKDSIIILNIEIDSLKLKESELLKTLNTCDSSNVAIRQELFVANYKLGRIKEYCEIVRKNNTQLKFLRGWIMRVLED